MRFLPICSILGVGALAAAPLATAGPDFVSPDRPAHELAASTARGAIAPTEEVLFALDAATLDSVAAQQIDTAARWFARHPHDRIVLEGHTDSTGAIPYNVDLGMRRAQTVRDRLMRAGLPIERVLLVVFGEKGASATPNPLERRVVMYASQLPIQAIVEASLHERGADSVSWIENRSLYIETRAAQVAARP
jgi:outer membrane protein OmpA-like peptidoglycan-associated protein